MEEEPSWQQELHFVNVNRNQPRLKVDVRERRTVRAFVMRDYLRQKNDPHWKFSPAKISASMSTHINRFRTTSKRSKRRSSERRPHRQRSPSSSSEPADKPKAFKHITPAPEPSMDVDNPLGRLSPHGLDSLDPFQILSVGLSNLDTLKLLQYYHTAFWANSYACNPEGRWISIALADPAIIHATLSLVAIHRRDCYAMDPPVVYLKHRGEAIRLISERLGNATKALSDGTIGAVAILSSSDNHAHWPSDVQESHINGLAKLVAFRGGIDSLSTNRHIKRVVGWADLLHAATHDTLPRLGKSKCAVEPPASTLRQAMGEDNVEAATSGMLLQDLPPDVRDVFRQLRLLSKAKSLLLSHRTEGLCEMFSNMLWKLEHQIVALEARSDGDGKVSRFAPRFWHDSMLKAIRTAALIFTYSALRDLKAPILFQKLTQKLRGYLSALWLPGSGDQPFGVDDYFGLVWQWGNLDQTEAALLLWTIYSGWKGALFDQAEREWFTMMAARLCSSHSILSAIDIFSWLNSVVLLEGSQVEKPDEFWDEVQLLL